VKSYRLNRLFHATSGRCFDVAVDHGMPGEPAFLEGIEDMERAIDALVDAAPDAIQLAVGQADLLQRHPGRDKPALVLRTDTANIYAPAVPEEAWTVMVDDPVTPSGSTPRASSSTCSTSPGTRTSAASAWSRSGSCAPSATARPCR
jgi:DhnA family fructose-bisphosphate aldolase class Ia